MSWQMTVDQKIQSLEAQVKDLEKRSEAQVKDLEKTVQALRIQLGGLLARKPEKRGR